MPAKIPHRIDSAQHAVAPSSGSVRLRGRRTATVNSGIENSRLAEQKAAEFHSKAPQNYIQAERAQSPPHEQSPDPGPGRSASTDPDAWLRAHAADLIDHLQNWSMDLDQRESSLNARIAMHERRERQFRIHRTELEQQLARSQSRVDQIRQQLEDRTRRLAFENHS